MRPIRFLAVLTAATALAMFASRASVQDPHAFDAVHPDFETRYAAHAWTAVPADRTLARVLGPRWLERRDALGSPAWFVGPGVSLGTAPLDEAACVHRASALVADLREDLALHADDALVHTRTSVTRNARGHSIVGVDFGILNRGFALRTLAGPRRVKVRIDATLGRLIAIGSDAVPIDRTVLPASNVDAALLDRTASIAHARRHAPAYAPGTGSVEAIERYLLVGRDANGRATTRLVDEVRIRVVSPVRRWRVVIDARTGERIAVRNLIAHVDVAGTVAGGSLDSGAGAPPNAPFSITPLRDLYVTLAGRYRGVTDATGAFKISVPGALPAATTLSTGLRGRYCAVTDVGGPDLVYQKPVGAGTNIVLNGTHRGEYATAQVTAYRWVTDQRYRIAQYIPRFTGLTTLQTNVNLNNACNAFWDGSSLNFFRAGNGCENTAFRDVVAHEYGHAFHQWFHGSLLPAGFSEGIGDHLALYNEGDRRLGNDLYGSGTQLRDYRAQGGACCTQWPPKNVSPHKDGEIWAGFAMDLRDALMVKHGRAAGRVRAELITIAQYDRDPADMEDGVLEVFIQDDDDANLANGTPNFAEIAAAADAHAIPRVPDPLPVVINHAALADSRDVVNGYPVNALVTARLGPLATVSVQYRVNGTGFSVLPMRAATNNGPHRAVIPAANGVARVEYAITAVDAANNRARSPAAGYHTFVVGRYRTAFTDDFEADRGWTPARDDTAISGRFERADPHFSTSIWGTSQPEDDTSPGGTQCYVTGNGIANQVATAHDVDTGHTSAVSPGVDLSAAIRGTARVSFDYWLTDYTVTDDVLRLESSIDGSTWSTIWMATTSLAQWRSATVRIPGAYSSKTQIRFRVGDNPNNSVCDALIDEVKIEAPDAVFLALRADTHTPTRGSTLQFKLAAPSAPGATWMFSIAFTAGPTPIAGIGTSQLGLPFFPLVFGVLDRLGTGAFPLPVPADPALAGLRVLSEAIAVRGPSDFAFSNRWDFLIR